MPLPGEPGGNGDTGQALTAIRVLEEGAPAAMVIDDRHRVDRTGLTPVGRDGPSGGYT